MALATLLAVSLLTLTLVGIYYLHQPKCPHCRAVQHTRDRLDDSIRICRHCGHIYRVR